MKEKTRPRRKAAVRSRLLMHWMIITADNEPYAASNAYTKKDAIQRHESDFGVSWASRFSEGDRAVRVHLQYNHPLPRKTNK